MSELRPVAVHPGELLADYLESHDMSARDLARRLGVATTSVTNILRKRTRITAEMALGLERIFIRPARLWLTLQMNWDLQRARAAKKRK